MGQRAGSSTEADSDDGLLAEPLLRDEVDDLVAAWRAQRPDLDVEPMQVLSRISRLARHLDIARRGAFAEHELESWEFDVLSALRRQGPPFQLTPGALLRATLVTSGTMTNRIDRLAASGLVRREPDPRDKRGVLVTLTDQGQERVDAALAGLLRRERALLAGLDAGEQRHLAGLMRILLAPFDYPGSLLSSARLRAPSYSGFARLRGAFRGAVFPRRSGARSSLLAPQSRRRRRPFGSLSRRIGPRSSASVPRGLLFPSGPLSGRRRGR
jgi:DNA-binding MarR family transcriptional regulator